MSKVVTVRIDEEKYKIFKMLALQENRPLSNFIETATMRYIEEHGLVDEFEMDEIRSNEHLNKSMKKGISNYKAGKGSFA